MLAPPLPPSSRQPFFGLFDTPFSVSLSLYVIYVKLGDKSLIVCLKIILKEFKRCFSLVIYLKMVSSMFKSVKNDNFVDAAMWFICYFVPSFFEKLVKKTKNLVENSRDLEKVFNKFIVNFLAGRIKHVERSREKRK